MMGSTLQWNEIYCFQKFLPLLTRWQLHHSEIESNNSSSHGFVEPDIIKKKRAPKGVPSYEIIWKDPHKKFLGLLPDDQIKIYYSTSKSKDIHETEQVLWSTIEPADLVEKAYPDLVERFQQSKSKIWAKKDQMEERISIPKKESRVRLCIENTDRNCDTIEGRARLKINPKKNLKSKRPLKSIKKDKLQTVDAFLRKEDLNQLNVHQSPKIRTSSKPMNLSVLASEFTDSFMSTNDSEMDLSNIIDEIVSRTPPITEVIGKRLRFDDIHIMEESFDDFDRLVMQKGSNGNLEKTKNSRNNQRSKSILKSNAKIEDIQMTPILDESTNQKKIQLYDSFFNVNLNDEVDLFEKSVDFRNMEDLCFDEKVSIENSFDEHTEKN